ncbi:reverse transcriptase [Plakobranchus ocellatus]|uniref:Reverse transcriptase n=1 Tax=Plakobranchus ocellatus TaxID=259542 RepID=A0AAV3YA85_9GAST|nr:reverse transcriptase [Plakobranchus ocellatus]
MIEKCSRDPPKGGENDGSIGDYLMLTETAPRTTRTKTTNFGLEMDYSYKTLENQSQVQNHSAKEIEAENRDDVLRHPSSDKRHKINFPPASSGKQWEDLDSKIVLKIDSLLGKSTLEQKLATFGDMVYQTCLDTFGAKQHQPKCPPKRSRRQLEMDTLRKKNRKLKKQIRAASSEEMNGLLVIWRQLKARHLALSRAESARKKPSQKRKNQERFIRDPFQFEDTSSNNPSPEP